MKKIFKKYLFHYSEILMSCLINTYSMNDYKKMNPSFWFTEILILKLNCIILTDLGNQP